MRKRRLGIGVGFGALALLGAIGAFAGTYGNHNAITIPDATGFGSNTPNPVTSTINVSEVGTVQPNSVSVKLFDVTSQWPDDLDISVTGPSSTAVVLWSDAGGDNLSAGSRSRPNTPITNPTDVTFSDAAGGPLPDSGAISDGGIYQPSNYTTDANEFGCGPEDLTGGSALSAFNNQQSNGNWVLTVQDDCAGNTSNIAGGWQITLNSPSAARVHGLSSRPTSTGVVVRWTTGNEASVLGYNLFRGKAKVNRTLIRAKASGTARGASYRVVDRTFAGKGATYRLEIVNLDGSRSSGGFVSLGRF